MCHNTCMIAVIIAGGSGTRLWPLSTPDFPKHLLNLAGEESLLQGTYRRVAATATAVYVITEGSHADQVRQQLPELPDDAFIVEPGRRGTANCIVAGLHYVGARHDADEPIAFIAADHFVRDRSGFARTFKQAEEASRRHKKIVLIGIEPTYPSTGFGYIHKVSEPLEGEPVYDVQAFKEKPPFETARAYLNSGEYLWNCSYFVGSLHTFLRDMERFSPELKANYDRLDAADSAEAYKHTYLSFLSETIDYAFADKVAPGTFLALPASFDWMDIGSYQDAHDTVGTDESGNHLHGDNLVALDVENSFVRNHEDKPVVVIGLDNIVVVNTSKGVLVTRKDLSQKVKEAIKHIQA